MPPPTSFAAIRKALAPLEREALVKLIGELHALNERNRDFLATRFLAKGGTPERYKKIIRKALCPCLPDEDSDVSFREARRAIGDYRKASGDAAGLAGLLVFAAECGTRFTLEYGDIDEPFYNALENLFADAAKAVSALDAQTAAPLIARLRELLVKVDGTIGWGLHEGFACAFHDAFGE
jgi:hypothetical protein